MKIKFKREVKMNKIFVIGLVVAVLVVAGIAGVFAYNKQDVKIIPCSSCNGSCNADSNCGLASCGAVNGGTCNCASSGGCGSCNGSCGGNCGLSGCSATASTTKSCGCSK